MTRSGAWCRVASGLAHWFPEMIDGSGPKHALLLTAVCGKRAPERSRIVVGESFGACKACLRLAADR